MLDWQFLFGTTSDPSIIFDRFYSSILEVIDQHIQIKQMSRKELKLRCKPWITSAIKKSILVKNKLHKKFLKTKSAYYFSKFKYYRNKLNHLLKIQKRKYYIMNILLIIFPIAKEFGGALNRSSILNLRLIKALLN